MPNRTCSYPVTSIFYTLCLCVLLTGCQKEENVSLEKPIPKIELIQDDLVKLEYGQAISKTAFTGTIRAVNQSSLQAQVNATATAVNAQVGDRVQKGQVLVQLNNQDNAARLAQSQANLAQAQAQLKLNQSLMQRKKRLLDQGFISRLEYEQSQLDYQSQLENVRAQQANVEIATKANQDGIIYSPLSGIITLRQVEPGQTVSVGQTLFEIIDPTQLEIQAKLPSEQQNALVIGQSIEFRMQGQSDTLHAKLNRISPLADLASRQIEFFAQPHEQLPSLSIGAFVEGYILGNSSAEGYLIPLNTIQDAQNKPYVWVIRHNKIVRAPIQLLEQRYQDNLAVVTGLQPDDQVSRVSFSEQQMNQSVIIQP